MVFSGLHGFVLVFSVHNYWSYPVCVCCRYLLCGQTVTGEQAFTPAKENHLSSASLSGATMISATPPSNKRTITLSPLSEDTRTAGSHAVQVVFIFLLLETCINAVNCSRLHTYILCCSPFNSLVIAYVVDPSIFESHYISFVFLVFRYLLFVGFFQCLFTR